MDTSNVVALTFFGVLIVPVLLYVVGKYEAPESFSDSLQQIAWSALILPFVFVAMNFLGFGSSFPKWQWAGLVGLAIGLPIRLLIDWFAVRHRDKLENL